MRLKAILYASLMSFLAVTAMPAAAQFDNTLNLFTPYTLYGVGNLNTGGTAAAGTMAGVGAAMRSATSFNAVNPASYSAASAQTFIFSFGMQGQNDYLKSKNYRSSHNAFSINDVSMQFRIAAGVRVERHTVFDRGLQGVVHRHVVDYGRERYCEIQLLG